MHALRLPEILAAFDAVDREGVTPPDLATVAWGEIDYLAWRHLSEPRVFMVVPLPERLVGLVVRTHGGRRGGFCDLCYSVDRDHGTTLGVVDSWIRPRQAMGFHVCASFACSEGARGLRFVYRMGEASSTGRRIERLQDRVSRFARHVTGLEA